MAVILSNIRLAYFPVPKNACTSLKLMLFDVENGFPFPRLMANGALHHIHKLYPSELIKPAHWTSTKAMLRIAIVRDPIDRFLSAYSNRVLHHREIEKAPKRPKNLSAMPSVSELIDNLDEYRCIWTISHHTAPQVEFIGKELAQFYRVFPFEHLQDCAALICELAERNIALPHEQAMGPRISRADLSRSNLKKLQSFYAADYALLSGIY